MGSFKLLTAFVVVSFSLLTNIIAYAAVPKAPPSLEANKLREEKCLTSKKNSIVGTLNKNAATRACATSVESAYQACSDTIDTFLNSKKGMQNTQLSGQQSNRSAQQEAANNTAKLAAADQQSNLTCAQQFNTAGTTCKNVKDPNLQDFISKRTERCLADAKNASLLGNNMNQVSNADDQLSSDSSSSDSSSSTPGMGAGTPSSGAQPSQDQGYQSSSPSSAAQSSSPTQNATNNTPKEFQPFPNFNFPDPDGTERMNAIGSEPDPIPTPEPIVTNAGAAVQGTDFSAELAKLDNNNTDAENLFSKENSATGSLGTPASSPSPSLGGNSNSGPGSAGQKAAPEDTEKMGDFATASYGGGSGGTSYGPGNNSSPDIGSGPGLIKDYPVAQAPEVARSEPLQSNSITPPTPSGKNRISEIISPRKEGGKIAPLTLNKRRALASITNVDSDNESKNSENNTKTASLIILALSVAGWAAKRRYTS